MNKYVLITYRYNYIEASVVTAETRDNALIHAPGGELLLCELAEQVKKRADERKENTAPSYSLSKDATVISLGISNISVKTWGPEAIRASGITTDKEAWIHYAISHIFEKGSRKVIVGNYIPLTNFNASCYYCGESSVEIN